MLQKSSSAMLAAVEIYNKPTFTYREESFAILAINAWELLLKSRILHLNSNKSSSIYEYENTKNKDGKKSKKPRIKRSRSNLPKTIGLFPALKILKLEHAQVIDDNIVSHLEALTELRDISVHFYHKDFSLRRRIHELGTASIRNYLALVFEWYGEDFTDHEFFLMPLAFINPEGLKLDAVKSSSDEKLAMKFFESLAKENTKSANDNYSIMLSVDVTFAKSSNKQGYQFIKFSTHPDAKPVTLSEEDISKNYPLSYQDLANAIRKKLPTFKQSDQFHRLKAKYESDQALCLERHLDPSKPSSSSKKLYNPNMVKKIIDDWVED